MNLFSAQKITSHTYRIIDAFGAAFYLVTGKRYACLLDTGYGFRTLRSFIESITNLPVFVLLTHGHIDHAMGCSEFEKVYMNYQDLEVYKAHSNDTYRFGKLSEYINENKIEAFKNYHTIFQDRSTKQFYPLRDQDKFDLGEITISAYSLPGHTPGTMIFLIKEDRLVLFGDACGPGTLLIEEFSTNLQTYYQSLLKTKQIENAYDMILRNHGTYQSKKDLLDNVIMVCQDILHHKDDKILLPASEGEMFPIYKPLKMYKAKRTIIVNGVEKRIDHIEGNISYREDKVP